MAKGDKDKNVNIDIQYQIKIGGEEKSKTYEYQHVGSMKRDLALDKDPFKREINLLKFLQKEFKEHAKKQKKKLLAKRKSAKKPAG